MIDLAGQAFHHRGVHPVPAQEVLDFLAERLRVALRAEGRRHDVLAAVFAAGADDVIPRLLSRAEAVTALLASDNGANLLTAYRRAANILRIEDSQGRPSRRRAQRGADQHRRGTRAVCAVGTRMKASPHA